MSVLFTPITPSPQEVIFWKSKHNNMERTAEEEMLAPVAMSKKFRDVTLKKNPAGQF